MKIPSSMIEMFLRSSGASDSMIQLYKVIEAEGLGAFEFIRVPVDDPNWAQVGADPAKNHFGMRLRAAGKDSRIWAAIFIEGANDETLRLLTDTAVQHALPA